MRVQSWKLRLSMDLVGLRCCADHFLSRGRRGSAALPSSWSRCAVDKPWLSREPKGRASSPLRAHACNHDFLQRKRRRARSDAPYLRHPVHGSDARPILEVEALQNLVATDLTLILARGDAVRALRRPLRFRSRCAIINWGKLPHGPFERNRNLQGAIH